MPGNSFGQQFRITTFGESHGEAIGVVIDGCPAGLKIDTAFIQTELNRRRPGQSKITTQRNETDEFKIISGVFENITTGTPIAIIIPNLDQKSADYDHLKDVYRPSHADYTYETKYGVRDYRGSGRASARETVARVAAGAVAKLLLQKSGIKINAFVSQVANVELEKSYTELNLDSAENNPVRCPDEETAQKMIVLIEQVKNEGDTVGGTISCVVANCPVGLGEPVFDKLHADLAKAVMSINAVKGFEIGSGFEGAMRKGSEENDRFSSSPSPQGEGLRVRSLSNNSGGIQGGISNGLDIFFRVAFKPVSTLMKDQITIDKSGNEVELKGKGRHDACVLPRAVPIVEAMTALVIADHLLRNKTSKI